MKTRLISLLYAGCARADRRLSAAMLPWLLREIAANGTQERLSVTVEDGCLKAYNANFEPVFLHRLVDILRVSQPRGRPHELYYVMLDPELGLRVHLFLAASGQEVSELFVQMREASPGGEGGGGGGDAVTRNAGFQQSCEAPPWTAPAITLPNNCNSNLGSETPPLVRSVSNASNLTSLNADLSLSDSHFFEVLYIGKVRISQRKVPETLIDDALHKLAQHEIEKAKNQRRHSLLSSTGTSVYSQDSSESINEKSAENVITFNKMTNLVASTTPLEPTKHSTWKSDEDLKEMKHNFDDEFDMFTKERVEKNNNIPTKTDTQTPLETTNLTINVPKKKNLGTVSEDEESPEESPKPNENDQNPLNTVLKIVEDGDVNKNTTRPKLERKPSVDDSESRLEKITENVPVGKIKFEEISRKPNASNSNKMNDMNENRRNSMPENKPFLRDRSASIGTINSKTPISHLLGEQNRTMLFQVGRSELRLISPDRKQILLHRALPDVASVVAGRAASDHLGVVCREPARTPAGGPPSSGPPAGGPPASGPPAGYACYVFRCESNAVTKELVAAIKQAFAAHAELMKKSRERSSNQSCEHCPLLWFHRLCHDVEGMTEKRIHAFILRRIEQLPEDEQDSIITKYQGGTNHMYETNEHNAFLMMLLRAHCEAKQLRHVHDTAENRSEFLNQYLGGSTIFMKAKRSLSNSFDHLLKRRASRDDHINVAAVKKESPPPPPPAAAARSSQSPAVISDTSEPTLSLPPPQRQDSTSDEAEEPPATSPIMDIFLKVSDSRPAPAQCGSETGAGWRQALYQQAVQPVASDGTNELSRNFLGDPQPAGKRSREQLRQLWRLAIDQTVLLIRMEKENNRLKESEEHSALRRIKLEYAELQAAGAGAAARWEDALQRRGPADATMLAHAVRQGVPRGCRGAVWYFLAEQAARRLPPPAEAPLYRAPYKALLAKLTKHQHAILIDLGRTFPQHSYFASALGPGQLALYNVLKAYSILDPEVGYCQGLSFVAAVLLLHLDEPDAFALLRHLMFRRGLRNQYLPDMSALQVQLYQLSRLLRDAEPELHERLRALDVPASLYAAPWMLTLFTAHFPLGFVVAVFDLIFLDSLDVVFSVSLALLSVHKDGLMLCESCEEAAEYLKHKLPDVDKNIYEKVMKKVHSLDVSRQLREYAAEYRVLREQVPAAAALQADRDRLAADARRLADQLDMAMDTIGNYQASQARLETQNKMMEQQLALLSRYVSAHAKHDAPNEVKKILQTYNKKTSFGSKIFSSKFSSNEEEESEKKIFKTGTSAPNLFAKISKDEVMNAINKEKNSPEKTEQLDRKHFMMKKSQSMHSGLIANNLRNYPLKVLDEKYERSDSFKSDGILADSLKEIGKKNSGYFASTHEQIRQERMFEQQLKHDFDENLKKLDERLAPNSHLNDLNIFQSKKSMSLNLTPTATVNDLKSNDSGFVTPLSPNEKERKHETTAVISHPLSDVDADIKFDGHSTILKQIRPLRNNSISLDTKHA